VEITRVNNAPAARPAEKASNQGSQRLFIALYPDKALRQEIAGLQGLGGIMESGRRIPVDNIHTTLFFLGQIDQPSRACIEHAAGDVCGKSFKLVLDRLGYWSRPQILWLAPSQMPHELITLLENMKTRLVKCGVTPDKRPFKLHLTLARKVRKPPPRIKIEPLLWHVKHYSLMESLPSPNGGVNYQELACWELK